MASKNNILRANTLTCPQSLEELKKLNSHTGRVVLDLIGRVPFTESPPLNPQVVEETYCENYVRKKVRYGNESDDIVWAWLLIPHGLTGANPAIICLPGSYMTPNWGKDATVGLAGPSFEGDPECYGADLAEQGYITLCPDYPCAGERVHEGLKQYDTSDLDRRFPDWTRTGMSLWDVSRAVDFLLTLSNVDSRRIGCTGLSQGGEMSILGTAIDARISVTIPVCGLFAPWNGMDMTNYLMPYNWPELKNFIETNSILSFSQEHLVAMIAPRPTLIISASQDPAIQNLSALTEAESQLQRVWDLFGYGKKFEAIHLNHTHRYSPKAAKISLEWFNRWLR